MNLWTQLNWESICGDTIFLGGGHAEGWTFYISDLYEASGGFYTEAYAVVAGSFPSLSSDGVSYAERYPCNSSAVSLAWAAGIVLLVPASSQHNVPGRGTFVGTLVYMTDYSPSGQSYSLYIP